MHCCLGIRCRECRVAGRLGQSDYHNGTKARKSTGRQCPRAEGAVPWRGCYPGAKGTCGRALWPLGDLCGGYDPARYGPSPPGPAAYSARRMRCRRRRYRVMAYAGCECRQRQPAQRARSARPAGAWARHAATAAIASAATFPTRPVLASASGGGRGSGYDTTSSTAGPEAQGGICRQASASAAPRLSWRRVRSGLARSWTCKNLGVEREASPV